jgi:hypothetical protein
MRSQRKRLRSSPQTPKASQRKGKRRRTRRPKHDYYFSALKFISPIGITDIPADVPGVLSAGGSMHIESRLETVLKHACSLGIPTCHQMFLTADIKNLF